MRFKVLVLIVLVMFVLLSGCVKNETGESNAIKPTTFTINQSNDLDFYSIDVYDATSFSVEGQQYTILLNDDAIYSIDSNGKIKNKITHSLSISNPGDLTNSNMSLNIEIIDDIDGKGKQDLLLIIKEGLIDRVSNIMAISYEEGTIIWNYDTTMEVGTCTDKQQNCYESVPITQYKLKKYLYVSAGYSFQTINLSTGEIIKQYNSHNNIWDFEFVNDLTDDGQDEIVVVTQPNQLTVLDGQNHIKIKEIDIKTDIWLTSYLKLMQNIWDIAYIQSRDQLIAACENGTVYEISLKDEYITNSYTLYDTSTEEYREHYLELIQSKPIRYEYELLDETTVYFGRKATFYKNIDIHQVRSIDQDTHYDYIMSFNQEAFFDNETSSLNNGTYAIISSENGKIQKDDYGEFYAASLDYYYVSDRSASPSNSLFKNIRQEQNIANEVITSFSSANENLISKVFFLENNQFIIVTKSLEIALITDKTRNEKEITVHFKYSSESVRQKHEIVSDYLVIKDYNLKLDLTRLTFYNHTVEPVYTYKIKRQHEFIKFTIDQDYLYLLEYNYSDSSYSISVVDLLTGKIIKQVSRLEGHSHQKTHFYDDLNNDGFIELVTTSTKSELVYTSFPRQTAFDVVHMLKVYDFVNDKFIFQRNRVFEGVEKGSYYGYDRVDTVNDLNQDGHKELLLINPIGGRTYTELFYSSKSEMELFNQPIELPQVLNNQCYIDYNSNGSFDFITKISDFDLSMFDYKLNAHFPINKDQDVYKYIFLHSCNIDFNNDGINDIVTLEMDESLPIIDSEGPSDYRVDMNLTVKTFQNDQFIPLFNYEFSYEGDYITLEQINDRNSGHKFGMFVYDPDDQNYQYIMYKFDQFHNVVLEEVSLSNPSEKVEYKVTNPFTQTKEEGYYRYGKDISLITYMGELYYIITINDQHLSTHYMIDPKDQTIDYVVYGNHMEVFNNQMITTKTVKKLDNPFLFNNQFTKIDITKPFSSAEIKISTHGLLENRFKVNIERDDIKQIRHYYSDTDHNVYHQNFLWLTLPPGKHYIDLEIETLSGEIFYFNDTVIVKPPISRLLLIFGLLLLVVISVYSLIVYRIKVKYFKSI